jgi:uncharacterized membrane protein YadS
MKSIDWSSLWRKEDWWAVWVGFIILTMGITRCLPAVPQIASWGDITKSFSVEAVIPTIILFMVLFVLTIVSLYFMRKDLRYYFPSFITIFCAALLAMWLGKYLEFTKLGLETLLWALIIGLLVSNIVKLPGWLKAGVQTELFINIGLVLLGAEILFSTIVKGGLVGMGQGLVVVVAVWFFAYWLGRKLGMSQSFASVMASGVSICGVSAAIASGGAVKGNPKETSYVISLVLLGAVPMLIGMPLIAKAMGLTPAMAGAWIGGTIDTTGAVVAAGAIVDPKIGLTVASLVKMAQNAFIGFAAFFLAIWSTVSAGKGKSSGEKPSVMEIWYRFPKFILGFVAASLLFSILVEPNVGSKPTNDIIAITKGYREWFFVVAFVCVGLDTRFKDLITVGKGKPALAFCLAQMFNILWTLVVVWLLWSGMLFAVPV